MLAHLRAQPNGEDHFLFELYFGLDSAYTGTWIKIKARNQREVVDAVCDNFAIMLDTKFRDLYARVLAGQPQIEIQNMKHILTIKNLSKCYQEAVRKLLQRKTGSAWASKIWVSPIPVTRL